ncbi:hypothetical protein [Kutzneria sp. CA-103260]|uniref:hypothetical protein n=1 Tax=Kutzneria sp. CA-103260 TaxID=2802641 RepID=UPI001BABAB2A|nr:hypothetical protein [Kutzneria sp. CA-103260]QUQ68805.1 Taurine catabolism dioxygenase TauD, TfdA family [Kutzneria sp. CA-103260]
MTVDTRAVLRPRSDLGALIEPDWRPASERMLLDAEFRTALVSSVLARSEAFTELGGELVRRLRRYPYYAVLRGMHFDPDNILFGVVACLVGKPVQPYPDPTFAVLRELRPSAASTSAGWGVLTEFLHSDSTNWPAPNDVTVMLCRKPDQASEGTSLVLPLDDAIEELNTTRGLGTAAVERLRTQPLPWAIDPDLGGGTTWAPALAGNDIRWQLYRIAEARDRDGALLDDDTFDFAGTVDAALANSRRTHEFMLGEDDVLVINNKRLLHGRRGIADPVGSRRVLVHCKVDFDDSGRANGHGA